MIFNMIYGGESKSPTVGDSYDITNIKTLGGTVKWNNTDWLVVHVEKDTSILAIKNITELTQFGTNNVYAGSTLENICKTYESNVIPESFKLAIDTTVHSTTHKIYIPESTCFSAGAIPGNNTIFQSGAGSYDWYKDSDSRICKYYGTSQGYWSASYYDGAGSTIAWIVDTAGLVYGISSGVKSSLGFRPHVRIATT